MPTKFPTLETLMRRTESTARTVAEARRALCALASDVHHWEASSGDVDRARDTRNDLRKATEALEDADTELDGMLDVIRARVEELQALRRARALVARHSAPVALRLADGTTNRPTITTR